MSSIVISPFWQGVDQQWIGAILIVLTIAAILSTSLSLVRARSINMFLLTAGWIIVAALLLAPKADSTSPRIFQLWLMSPETLGTLSVLQILTTVLVVFGSIRQEACADRRGELLHELRSWLIAFVTILPQPILLVFIFWVEQNMMIEVRQAAPTMIGLQVAGVAVVVIAMLVFIVSRLSRYLQLSLHSMIGFFMIASGALLPCLTIKLSFAESGGLRISEFIFSAATLLVLVAIFTAGLIHARRMTINRG